MWFQFGFTSSVLLFLLVYPKIFVSLYKFQDKLDVKPNVIDFCFLIKMYIHTYVCFVCICVFMLKDSIYSFLIQRCIYLFVFSSFFTNLDISACFSFFATIFFYYYFVLWVSRPTLFQKSGIFTKHYITKNVQFKNSFVIFNTCR